MPELREMLESRQVAIYFAAVAAAAVLALAWPGAASLEPVITPLLALMLFATFLQMPMTELPRAFANLRFLAALLVSNFLVVPVLVAGLIHLLPEDMPMLRLGVLLVLLCPCVDYVVTFSGIGRADSRALLAATPVLLLAQMAMLPVTLTLLLGREAQAAIALAPFLDAFATQIVAPLALAALVQGAARRHRPAERIVSSLGLLAVPATALVLFTVVAAMLPRIAPAAGDALMALPIYGSFAALAPLLGWAVARLLRLEAMAGRAVAFSSATRNSLVILPLALAIPGGIPVLPAVIVTQTLVELAASLAYMRLMPSLGRRGRSG